MITIRRIARRDGKAVKELILRIMDEEFHDAKSAYPTDDIENIEKSYGGSGEAFFVACSGDKILGTVAIKKEDERLALMRRLFVSSEYRKQQIGSKLIDHALQFCREIGYQEIIFRTTSNMEGANKACQKCGFVPRAKLSMGSIELFKFTISLRNGRKKSGQHESFRRQSA